MNVELQGVTIEVSEEKKTYCLMYRDFLAAEKIVSEEFEKNYKKYIWFNFHNHNVIIGKCGKCR